MKKKTNNWILEYRWMNKSAYSKYPCVFYEREEYDKEWHSNAFSTYSTAHQAEEFLIKALKVQFSRRTIEGRHWRVRNTSTGQIILLTELEKLYEK